MSSGANPVDERSRGDLKENNERDKWRELTFCFHFAFDFALEGEKRIKTNLKKNTKRRLRDSSLGTTHENSSFPVDQDATLGMVQIQCMQPKLSFVRRW